jgi:hypothetical protein
VSGLKARCERRETPGSKFLKDRRSPRRRGRMGTSVARDDVRFFFFGLDVELSVYYNGAMVALAVSPRPVLLDDGDVGGSPARRLSGVEFFRARRIVSYRIVSCRVVSSARVARLRRRRAHRFVRSIDRSSRRERVVARARWRRSSFFVRGSWILDRGSWVAVLQVRARAR